MKLGPSGTSGCFGVLGAWSCKVYSIIKYNTLYYNIIYYNMIYIYILLYSSRVSDLGFRAEGLGLGFLSLALALGSKGLRSTGSILGVVLYRPILLGLGFGGLGFRGLGFRGLGFWGFRGLGFWGFRVLGSRGLGV